MDRFRGMGENFPQLGEVIGLINFADPDKLCARMYEQEKPGDIHGCNSRSCCIQLPVVFWHGRSFNLVTFGLFAALGSFAGYSIFLYFIYTRGFPVSKSCWEMVLVFVLINLVFAKFFSILTIGIPEFFKHFRLHLNQTSFYQQGGVIGMILGTIVVCSLEGIPLATLGDAVCFGGIVTMFIGRLGCFNYGCCTGKPTHSRVGLIYRDPDARVSREHPELRNVPLIPVQLISATVDLALFILFCILSIYLPYTGVIMIVFFIGINIKRMALQPFRYKASSNKISYTWVAFILILIFFLIILFASRSGASFFSFELPVVPFNIQTYAEFLVSDWNVAGSIILGGAINFVAYGIHGRQLGTHFNLTP
jgi:prolipoprotein diacylglyceryltransferase